MGNPESCLIMKHYTQKVNRIIGKPEEAFPKRQFWGKPPLVSDFFYFFCMCLCIFWGDGVKFTLLAYFLRERRCGMMGSKSLNSAYVLAAWRISLLPPLSELKLPRLFKVLSRIFPLFVPRGGFARGAAVLCREEGYRE
jgi:hypothetical protein